MRTKEQTEQEFRADSKELFRKYNAGLEADAYFRGYANYGEDVRMTVDIPGIWDNEGNVLQEYTEINLGKFFDGK